MSDAQRTIGGTIAVLTSKIVIVLGTDLNLYVVDLEAKKGLRNPDFREGLCVEVIYKSKDSFRIKDVLVIVPIPIEEENGKTSELPVL